MARPSLLLIHGAANGAWVWDVWRQALRDLGWVVNVIDLRGHGRSLPVDFTAVTMEDYLADVASVAGQIEAAERNHPVIGGWSMGGLLAQMYAAQHPETPALLLFSASPPQEVAGRAPPEEVRRTPSGPFGPELYGLFPHDLDASRRVLSDLSDEEALRVLANSAGAQESGMARRQRKRGISIPAGTIRAPTLVVFGEQDRQFPPEVNRKLAIYLGAEMLAVPDAGHWGIVCHADAVNAVAPRVDAWLRSSLRL
jgi:pimeloyl-[acyl-carrier protein] methyl ester esterase